MRDFVNDLKWLVSRLIGKYRYHTGYYDRRHIGGIPAPELMRLPDGKLVLRLWHSPISWVDITEEQAAMIAKAYRDASPTLDEMTAAIAAFSDAYAREGRRIITHNFGVKL